MTPAYWDTVAADYEREVLSVFDHDAGGCVAARITAAGAARPDGSAADLGCGVGKFTPLLARAFAHVHACDQSAKALARTRARCRGHGNVSFRRFDLARDAVPFAPLEFVLCVNVVIMPSLDERRRVWRAVANQVGHGGTLLLVVPSLEAAQFARLCAIEACLDAGCTCAESLRRSAPGRVAASDLSQGVHRLDGLRTKHYLRDELEQMLPAHEFDISELVKLAYGPPKPDRDGVAAGTLWDWLVTARRR